MKTTVVIFLEISRVPWISSASDLSISKSQLSAASQVWAEQKQPAVKSTKVSLSMRKGDHLSIPLLADLSFHWSLPQSLS